MNKDQLQIRLSYWQRTLGMALIVTCFVLLAEFWSLTTHLAEYDRLYLGESSRDVDHTLAQAGIHSFDSTMPQGPQKCYFSDNASGAVCAPTGLEVVFNRKDGGFHGIATALGITLMDKGFIVFWNFSFITSQAQGNVVAHELAHQFTLLDTFWVGPSNLMCGGNNPTCPPLPSDYLDKDQIQRAQDEAKQWMIH